MLFVAKWRRKMNAHGIRLNEPQVYWAHSTLVEQWQWSIVLKQVNPSLCLSPPAATSLLERGPSRQVHHPKIIRREKRTLGSFFWNVLVSNWLLQIVIKMNFGSKCAGVSKWKSMSKLQANLICPLYTHSKHPKYPLVLNITNPMAQCSLDELYTCAVFEMSSAMSKIYRVRVSSKLPLCVSLMHTWPLLHTEQRCKKPDPLLVPGLLADRTTFCLGCSFILISVLLFGAPPFSLCSLGLAG